MGHLQMPSQFHELSRQQALILELPTSHIPLFSFLSLDCDTGSRRRGNKSAMVLGPGVYFIVNLYGCILRGNISILALVFDVGVKIHSRGLWSVINYLVRALAFHQSVPGAIRGPGVIDHFHKWRSIINSFASIKISPTNFILKLRNSKSFCSETRLVRQI